MISCFKKRGISMKDPRLAKAWKNLSQYSKSDKISLSQFQDIFSHEFSFLEHIAGNHLVVPDFVDFREKIESIYSKVEQCHDGEVASYIPQLARVDPEKFAVSICTIDGQVINLGDFDELLCVQSSCKPINYCLALEEHGLEKVHSHIGHEPSGQSFNELSLNSKGLPHNPLINSGAIMACSLIKPNLSIADRFDHVLTTWKKVTNSTSVGFNNSVYLSERETADRNYALAYFMRENNAFPEGTNLEKTLEFYFQCCSIETNTKNLAVLAATLANGGLNPFSNEKVFESSTIKNCLSLMNSCGMYDYSGEFSFHIGLPAKSGVSGVVYVVVPNTLGICIWSPRLDKHGNSVRAIQFCKELTKTFLFHNYDSLVTEQQDKINPRLVEEHEAAGKVQQLCYAAARGDTQYIQSLLIRGVDINSKDYDKRTPLHLAVCEGQFEAVKYLILHGADLLAKDRWGRCPLDEVKDSQSQAIKSWVKAWSPKVKATSKERSKKTGSKKSRTGIVEA